MSAIDDPALGLAPEALAELASVDWHAAHPRERHYDGRRIAVSGGPDVHLAHRCPCEHPRVLGDFAVRLVTGQAPGSTLRDGTVVALYDASRTDPRLILHTRVMRSAHGALGQPVAVIRVHGHPYGCSHPHCEQPDCIQQVQVDGITLATAGNLSPASIIATLAGASHQLHHEILGHCPDTSASEDDSEDEHGGPERPDGHHS